MTALIFIFIISVMYPTVSTLHDSRSSLKHYCEVPSLIDHSLFNFTTIQREHDSIIRLNDNDYLRVHFCRPLKEPCNGKQDYAVCLHANRKEFGVGKEPPKVAIENGKIMFKYTGDNCNNTHNFTVDIEMKCSYSIKKIKVNLDILYNRDQCSFQTTVKTFAACAKRKRTTCEVHDDSDYYNLKPLMNQDGNYIVKVNENVSAILNVCHSLIYGQHFEACNHETMICLVDETNIEQPSYTRIGDVNEYVGFSTRNGSVIMDLSSETKCDKSGDFTELTTIRSSIQFVCNLNAFYTLPEYINGMGTCHYRFRWVTAAACSEKLLIKQSKVNHEPCTVRDPLYNEVFDVSTFGGFGGGTFTVMESDSDNATVHQFSLCHPLRSSNCTTQGIGVCKYIGEQNIAVSKGLANSNLMWWREQVFLNYTDGVACDSNRRSYTTIYFECAYTDYLVIVEKDPCVTIITWSLPAICSRRCMSPDGSWNMHQLREEDHNYHVAGETAATEYHVNVCKPMVDENYTNCTYGTGICKVSINDEGKRISETNLGIQVYGFQKAEDGRIYLNFLNGSICEEDNSRRISSEITFTCDVKMHAVNRVFLGLGTLFNEGYTFGKFKYLMQGIPIFKTYNNCKYDFIWNSSLFCPEKNNTVNSGCLVDGSIRFLNQTRLYEDLHFKTHRNDTTGTFSIIHCRKKIECHGTFVCANRNWDRKGLLHQVNIHNNLVAFKFVNDSECKKDNYYDSLIDTWCTVWEGAAESFLLEEGDCNTIVAWSKNDEEHCEPIKFTISAEQVMIIFLIIGIVVACATSVLHCLSRRNERLVGVEDNANHHCILTYISLSRRPADGQAAEDQAAEDQAADDQAAEDQAAEDQAAKDQAAEDQAAEEVNLN